MRVDVLTLFPDLVDAPLSASIVGRARQTGALDLNIHDIRTWTSDVHRTADDTPYGGGPGMVMKAEPIVSGAEWIAETHGSPGRTYILSASGKVLNHDLAVEIAGQEHLLLICGHYEGIDDRVRTLLSAEELSIGDYVLTGGELAAAVVIDCVTRLIPGVIKAESVAEESHAAGILEYPHFTRPATFRGLSVPDVLLSGNHAEINRWRHEQALLRTAENRPDLVSRMSDADRLALLNAPVGDRTSEQE
ncbi:MAG TPA: tRNA (guanosine(37)-N1)-methyltransferase TrmD [Thermomicrobiales bacterium]|nr:tRNA (guanosine(37)-N1)-methyltransferase TrmD [Thermomicrobiales bacterium]